jgi:pyruvate,water dikinase
VAEIYRLRVKADAPLVRGQAVGEKIGVGLAHVVIEPSDLTGVRAGEVLVARNTDPDWEPVMRRVAAIVTDQGGRTAHAAIVSREFGVPCIVGTGNATSVLRSGQDVTVCCAEGTEGHVYADRLAYDVDHIDASKVPETKTAIMLTVGDPGQAFALSAIPNSLLIVTSEFIPWHWYGIPD